ncbi:hypothetical protein S101258_00385 [Lactiplantibacillus plantarum subsp. plantarum]|uniref:Lipoprotein n=1 Tax=Lactiplantibacillus plantarum subsp. plantarum TaxID=337330 RepID=A0A2S3UA04_LACPN|nr:hypothetical protein S101258_00385 [Lactiplantibacillus plantarum subsp. plantarum]
MQFKKLAPLMGGLLVMSVGLAACGQTKTKTKQTTSTATKVAKATKQTVTTADVKNAKKLLINQKKWRYNAKNKVYYQVGVKYGTKTSSSTYESMGILFRPSMSRQRLVVRRRIPSLLIIRPRLKGIPPRRRQS